MEKTKKPKTKILATSTDIVPAYLYTQYKKKKEKEVAREVIRIAQFYGKFLMQKRMQAEKTFDGVPQQVARIAKIVFEAATKLEINLKLVKDMDRLREMLRKISGLQELEAWLRTKPNQKQILQESGKEDLFSRLWNLKPSRTNYSDYKNLETFLESVNNLGSWLRIVDFFISQNSATVRIAFATPTLELRHWRIEAIFITFLVSVTLETKKEIFSLEELSGFFNKVKDYDKWKENLENKIYYGFEKESGAIELYKHTAMQKIVADLQEKRHQTIAYFNKKIVLSRADQLIVKHFKSQFEQAARLVVDQENNQAARTTRQQVVNRISKLVGRMQMAYVYKLLKKETYFLDWLSDTELCRLLAYDSTTEDKELRNYIENQSDRKSELKSFFDTMDKQMSLAHFLGRIWQEKEPFGLHWAFVLKNRPTKNVERTPETADRFYVGLVLELMRGLGHEKYIEWLLKVEKSHKMIKESVPTHIALVVYLTRSTESLPRTIIQNLEKNSWFKYLDRDNVKAAFEARVKHLRFIREELGKQMIEVNIERNRRREGFQPKNEFENEVNTE